MSMSVEAMISLITNVGFPVSLCFILLWYILKTLGEKLDKLDNSMNQLNTTIKRISLLRNSKNESDSKKNSLV
ncbi:hypothetical protein ASL14_13180 [Paenibacillus sp. IHB B 3084]|nr:hypothetical protein ASL14_13180 [Paenibacillus sp. IHB B 3084]